MCSHDALFLSIPLVWESGQRKKGVDALLSLTVECVHGNREPGGVYDITLWSLLSDSNFFYWPNSLFLSVNKSHYSFHCLKIWPGPILIIYTNIPVMSEGQTHVGTFSWCLIFISICQLFPYCVESVPLLLLYPCALCFELISSTVLVHGGIRDVLCSCWTPTCSSLNHF